ncbi:NAD(P)-dependent dehydrogenase [Commensalibacter communis]|nr:NAD(P)-dependent dehydrogenase [Commensalibacter communis]
MVDIVQENNKNIFITGASSGIGQEVAILFLEKGYNVYSISRTVPSKLTNYKNWHFKSCDVTDRKKLYLTLSDFIPKQCNFEYVFLNAGAFGEKPNYGYNYSIDNFLYILDLNLVSNKVILDFFIKNNFFIKNVVSSSSIAGIRYRKAMLSYSVSKSGLNALIHIYALENPNIFFFNIGLCSVDTLVAETIINGAKPEFNEIYAFKQRSTKEGYIVSPKKRSMDILYTLQNYKELGIISGEFFEIKEKLSDRKS